MKAYYFLSETPVLVTVDGVFAGCAGAEPLKYQAEAANFVSVQPLTAALPYAFEITESSENLFYDFFTFPDNVFEIRLKHRAARPYSLPKLLAQSVKPYGDGNINFSVFADAYNQLLVEYGNYTEIFLLPDSLSDFRLKTETLKNRPLAVITAKTPSGQYINATVFDGGKARVLVSETAHRISWEKNRLLLYTARLDVAQRAEVKVYGADYLLAEKYYVYLNGSPVRTQEPRLIPFALFEAVKYGDYGEASYYLAPSLKAGLPKQKLEEFFADYAEIAENKYFHEHKDCVVFIDKSGKTALFKIEIFNGKIENITEIEY